MISKVKSVLAVLSAIVLGVRQLAAIVETKGHGAAKRAFVIGAIDVLMELDESLFSGFVGERIKAAAAKVLELWVAYDKIAGVFKKEKSTLEDVTGNS